MIGGQSARVARFVVSSQLLLIPAPTKGRASGREAPFYAPRF
jgi:hypothetical protein